MTTFTYQERFKTLKGVFDQATNRNLFELESHRYFEELTTPLRVGKESSVFLARKGKKQVIVKIYRVQNCDFKRMYEYIGKDPRYEYLKRNRRQIIYAWTQREYKNLMRAKSAGAAVPEPYTFMQNILVEEMIGEQQPAPPLKDEHPKDPYSFFEGVIGEMIKLYRRGLIHGDLSSFNILNHNEKPVLIDFSQATLVKTPNSQELLERDVRNVCQFFRKLGIHADFEETFLKVQGKE